MTALVTDYPHAFFDPYTLYTRVDSTIDSFATRMVLHHEAMHAAHYLGTVVGCAMAQLVSAQAEYLGGFVGEYAPALGEQIEGGLPLRHCNDWLRLATPRSLDAVGHIVRMRGAYHLKRVLESGVPAPALFTLGGWDVLADPAHWQTTGERSIPTSRVAIFMKQMVAALLSSSQPAVMEDRYAQDTPLFTQIYRGEWARRLREVSTPHVRIGGEPLTLSHLTEGAAAIAEYPYLEQMPVSDADKAVLFERYSQRFSHSLYRHAAGLLMYVTGADHLPAELLLMLVDIALNPPILQDLWSPEDPPLTLDAILPSVRFERLCHAVSRTRLPRLLFRDHSTWRDVADALCRACGWVPQSVYVQRAVRLRDNERTKTNYMRAMHRMTLPPRAPDDAELTGYDLFAAANPPTYGSFAYKRWLFFLELFGAREHYPAAFANGFSDVAREALDRHGLPHRLISPGALISPSRGWMLNMEAVPFGLYGSLARGAEFLHVRQRRPSISLVQRVVPDDFAPAAALVDTSREHLGCNIFVDGR